MRRRPPRSPLFPYTTLFRSLADHKVLVAEELAGRAAGVFRARPARAHLAQEREPALALGVVDRGLAQPVAEPVDEAAAILRDRKSTRLNSSHSQISYAVFCL